MICQSILVICVEHDLRVLIRRRLEDEGHFVVSATSAAEALLITEKITAPRLILIDADITGTTAPQIIASLRSTKGYEKIPIAQIGVSPRITGSCCSADPANLDLIVEWLKSGENDPTWTMIDCSTQP